MAAIRSPVDASTLVAVPDYNPTSEILDQWAGRTTAQATPSPEPAMP